MSKFFIGLLFLIMLGCKNKSSYVNFEKWSTSDRYDFGQLRANPTEVRELLFDVKDTTIHGEGRKTGEEFYRFNEDGNLVFVAITFDTVQHTEVSCIYNEDGLQSHSSSFSNNRKDSLISTSTTISRKQGEGSFLITSNRGNENRYQEHVKFDPDIVRKERTYPDGKKIIETYWFRNNKLNQLAQQQDDIKYTYQFFRNKNGFLDSVIQKSVSINSKSSFPYEKEVFVSNSQGDYTLYCKLRDKDTIDLEQNSYIYDQKGNWIRRLSYNKEVAIMPIKRRFSGYSLSIREISY